MLNNNLRTIDEKELIQYATKSIIKEKSKKMKYKKSLISVETKK